jgi:hypothetical protein
MVQMPTDRAGAGVEPGSGELAAELHDELDAGPIGRARGGLWRPGQRVERCVTALAVAGHEPADPALGDSVGAGDLRL